MTNGRQDPYAIGPMRLTDITYLSSASVFEFIMILQLGIRLRWAQFFVQGVHNYSSKTDTLLRLQDKCIALHPGNAYVVIRDSCMRLDGFALESQYDRESAIPKHI